MENRQQRGGWLGNGGGKRLPEVKRKHPEAPKRWPKMRFIRRGELMAQMAPRPDGETAERFWDDNANEWVLTQDAAASHLDYRNRGNFENFLDDLGLVSRKMWSPVSGQPCLAYSEVAVYAAREERVADRLVIEQLSVSVVELVAEIRKLKDKKHRKGRKQTDDTRERRSQRAVRSWRKGCLHLDGEELRDAPKLEGCKEKRINREQSDRIIRGIRYELKGQVDPDRKLLTPMEVERACGIERHTLRRWAKANLIRPVKTPFADLWERGAIESLKGEIRKADDQNPNRPLSFREAATGHSDLNRESDTRRLRRAVQHGRLKSQGLSNLPGSLLVKQHTVSKQDAEHCLAPQEWKPRDGFVAPHVIAGILGFKKTQDYASLQIILKDGWREGWIKREQSPTRRFPDYYEQDAALNYVESRQQTKPGKGAGGQWSNATRSSGAPIWS